MPSYALPSWIQAADPAAQFVTGIRTGATIGEAQARLAQEQEEARMRAQARQEQLAADMLQAKTRLDYENAYHQQTIDLEKQRLKETQAVNQARTEDAAGRLQEQIAHNMAMEEARSQQWGPSSVAAMKWQLEQDRSKLIRENVAKGMSEADAIKDAYVKVGGMTPGIAELLLQGGTGQRRTATRATEKSIDTIKKEIDKMMVPSKVLPKEEGWKQLPYEDTAKMMRFNELIDRLDKERALLPKEKPDVLPSVPVAPAAAQVQAPAAAQSIAPIPREESPYKEGQRIRNRKTGKEYIVRNGVPVPVDEIDSGEEFK